MGLGKLLISAGAMKAGTSYLYKMLETHPEVEVTPIKEIHYFAHHHTMYKLLDDSDRLRNFKSYVSHINIYGESQLIQRDLSFFNRYLASPVDDEWYESLFLSDDNCFKADFSNMASVLCDEGLSHMSRIARDVRVLYIMRDPFSRLWSHIKFHAAVNQEFQVLDLFGKDEFLTYFDGSGAAAQSRYASNLVRMRRHFSPEQLRVIYFEDLMGNPRRELASLFDFLGISQTSFDEETLGVVHNPGPLADVPPAFIEAAHSILAREFDELDAAGIDLHPSWSRLA